MPMRPSLAPGDVLEGKWRLEALLGAGGMGQVYRARDLALERTVAIKLLHEPLCEDPESVARFEREARAMARLEHAHITPIHAVGREGGRPFIVMKHLEGMSLARYLRSVPGPMPVPEVLALARQLCAGLDFIHQRGCVHRDIKPGNIFVSPGGHATLLDFGILWEHRGEELTRTGARLGTPSYMAPEQARGEPVDSRADIFSLGLVLLEALTGLPPSSTCRLLGEGPRAAVPALQAQAPWLPRSWVEVLVQATAMNPEQRQESALVLLAALEDAERTSTSPPVALASSTSTPPPAPVSAGRGKHVRRVSLVLLGGTSVGALLLTTFTHRRTAEAPAPPAVTASVSSESAAPARPAAATPSLAREALPVRDSTPARDFDAAPAAPGVATAAALVPEPGAPASSAPVSNTPASPTTAPGRTRGARAPLVSSTVGGDSRQKTKQGRGEVRVVTLHQGRAVWANVSVDGKHHGATPVSLELPAGRHSVRVERDGFFPQERPVEVLPGTKAVVRIELHE
ncbi:serine/threonine protein kinase [Cystobacter fuscus DSM 2262]|uniref:Serine/threonine protein kinase n=1 Tax=Cystobacter fuscus (strain ATCC 25194 / DSM 2262 / NBRC 100088 / M29) TaxID=1242864 RepID=S9QLR4_CYSF2|nr:serine/threonine-protein kinase [Cystobacter fuscus]EPX62209.1 serine/threonine protein kinase [Cystobacter fuscus DSM 2262]